MLYKTSYVLKTLSQNPYFNQIKYLCKSVEIGGKLNIFSGRIRRKNYRNLEIQSKLLKTLLKD